MNSIQRRNIPSVYLLIIQVLLLSLGNVRRIDIRRHNSFNSSEKILKLIYQKLDI